VSAPQADLPAPVASVPANELARRGWAARLSAFVMAALVIESVTGLWIWLAPFSLIAQVQVLLHTAAGLLMIVPCLWYLTRHILAWWRQTMTVVMVLGYVLLAFVLIALVSGTLLTWQAAFGLKRAPLWDVIHLVSSIGTFAVLAVHVPLAWQRRRPVARRTPALAAAVRTFVRRGLIGCGATAAALVAVAVAWPVEDAEFPVPADYRVSTRLQQFDEYRDSPLAPTYARTESGNFVRPDVMGHSRSCGTSGCHEQILAEWLPSAHRFSAMNPPFRQVQQDFVDQRGIEEARYCAGCHDPISLFGGQRNVNDIASDSLGFDEGSSCVVCHSISKTDSRGNADYVISPPQKYLWEATTGAKKFVSDFLIRAYPERHLADYDRNIMRTPEFCGACHKQFIPEALNRFGLAPGQNQYDEWRNSRWHDKTHADKDLSCRDCHMRLVPNSRDPGRGEAGDVRRSPDDGAHRHHGTIATNVLMPQVLKLEGWQRHVALTEQWIRGETVLPEIAHLWKEGPVAGLRLRAPEKIGPGEELTIRVGVTNRKVGHNFSTGPLDFVRAWIHLRIYDAQENLLAEWGSIDPTTRRIQDVPGKEHTFGNKRDQGTLVLEAVPVDEKGQPLVRHDLWKMAGGKGLRVIFPGYADNQKYRFVVPKDAPGPLKIKADLNFRRYRQEFLDLVVPQMEKTSGVLQPTVRQTAGETTVRIVRPKPAGR